jgi:outer membrane protein TolC
LFEPRAVLARWVTSLALAGAGGAVATGVRAQATVPAPVPAAGTPPASTSPAGAPTASPSAPAPSGPAFALEQAVARALSHNERARSSRMRTRAAGARVDKARAFFFPDLTLVGSYTRRAYDPGPLEHDAFGGSLTLGLVLFDARGFPLYSAAKREREAVELEDKEERRLLAFDAASLFLATLGQERVLIAAQKRVELAKQNLADARARAEAGLASSNDVTQVELEAAAAERDAVSARAEASGARLDLGYLVVERLDGRTLSEPVELLRVAQATAPDLAAALKQRPERARLDLLALRRRVLALQESAREPLMRWVPTLGLSAQGRLANEAAENPDASIGVTLTWSLWDGGERSADRDERLALSAITELDHAAASRSVEVEVERAIVSLERGQSAIEHARKAAAIADQNIRETSELYRQGLATALQVADASERLFRAEVELARAGYDMALGLLALREALGLDPFGKEPR